MYAVKYSWEQTLSATSSTTSATSSTTSASTPATPTPTSLLCFVKVHSSPCTTFLFSISWTNIPALFFWHLLQGPMQFVPTEALISGLNTIVLESFTELFTCSRWIVGLAIFPLHPGCPFFLPQQPRVSFLITCTLFQSYNWCLSCGCWSWLSLRRKIWVWSSNDPFYYFSLKCQKHAKKFRIKFETFKKF